jgi:YD repeat-containing protein
MRLLIVLLILLPAVLPAQPSKEEIKKHRIRSFTQKIVSGSDSQPEYWFYDMNGNDSVHIGSEGKQTIRNEFEKGRLTKKTHFDSLGKAMDIYEYAYQPDGSFRETYTDPYFKMQSFSWFNTKGLLLKSQSPDGNVTTYRYDGRGNMLSASSDAKNTGVKINHKYTYNPKGQLIRSVRNVDGNIVTTLYEYNSKGRLMKEKESGIWEGEKYELEKFFEYNGKGLVSKKTVTNKIQSPIGDADVVIEYSYEYY